MFPLKIVIFHSYVSLPEGNIPDWFRNDMIPISHIFVAFGCKKTTFWRFDEVCRNALWSSHFSIRNTPICKWQNENDEIFPKEISGFPMVFPNGLVGKT